MKRTFDPYTRTNQLIADGCVFAASFAAAYLIRFEGLPAWAQSKQFMLWLPYLLAARLWIHWKLGIYRFVWRYVSLSDALAIGRSLLVVTVLALGLRLFYPEWAFLARWVRLPLSVIALEFLLSLVGTLGARGLRRILYERGQRVPLAPDQGRKQVILYGAGRAGILLLKDLDNQHEIEVVGFVDDDPKKVGTIILGKRVLGRGEELSKIVREAHADEVMISIAAASAKTLRQIVRRCQEIPISVTIIPSLGEIVAGRAGISQVREVKLEDLLGRDSNKAEGFDEAVRSGYSGKRILVTGAGGSIGSELVRQLLLLDPDSIGILDKDENLIHDLEQELIFRYPGARIEPQIADIRYRSRLSAVFADFKPEVVFHAAAHKHVPLMEKHPCEAVLNNVYGTEILLKACRDYGVQRFIFISSDKAVNPSSIMGATKRVGEMLVRTAADNGPLRSASVRFGNVVGSRGSVIPLFQKQIRHGGPLTVTHPDVERFFMTVPEAVQLVLCAGSMGRQGEIFVLDMGDPRKILEVAHEVALLSGLVPGKDIEIAMTGLRAGEKITEELIDKDTETLLPTRYDKIRVVSSNRENTADFAQRIELLLEAVQRESPLEVRRILQELDIGFNPKENGEVGLREAAGS